MNYLNAQGQPQIEWPATFAVARSYVDQLERSKGLSGNRIKSIRDELTRAESASGTARADGLTELADAVAGEAGSSSDSEKVELLAVAVRDLAAAP
jgi:hypothetical protein